MPDHVFPKGVLLPMGPLSYLPVMENHLHSQDQRKPNERTLSMSHRSES